MSVCVLIADDHTLVREGLRALLERVPGVDVVAEASDGREALRLVGQRQPDIVLIDIAMAGLNGLEATQRIVQQHPRVRVIILSMHKNEEYIVQALQAGAVGYLLKDAAAHELENAIRVALDGGRYLSREVQVRVAAYEERFGFITAGRQDDAHASMQLTPREREVLQLIVEGRTMQDIADTLGISVKTVETHRYRLMDKLNIHHVTGLVRYAMKIGIIAAD